ncbi:hypothetical protein AB833_19725 [Chromatiales bacterium (ex Bugula neritina AB1)]|nr:hypothetical protein AB833_19725 [Chromatiales bacterium (ex Bugula neritina AB1)]
MPAPDQQFHQVQHVTVLPEHSGQRIDNFLMSLFKTVPRGLVYRLLRTGQVRVNKGRIKPAYKLSVGDDIRIPPVTVTTEVGVHVPAAVIKQVEASVIAENSHWIVLNKPAGLAVHGGTGVRFGVIDAIHKAFDNTSISLVHRLDRETSGVLVLAKNRPSAVHFQDSLRAGKVGKQYSALLTGEFENTVAVDAPLLKGQPETGDRMVTVDHLAGKPARSLITSIEAGPVCSLVDVQIDTGRTHQIRVHAAHTGHPVLGDPRYGDRTVNRLVNNLSDRSLSKIERRRMFLHAREIVFPGMPDQPDPSVAPDDQSVSADDHKKKLDCSAKTLIFAAPTDPSWQRVRHELNAK